MLRPLARRPPGPAETKGVVWQPRNARMAASPALGDDASVEHAAPLGCWGNRFKAGDAFDSQDGQDH